AILAIVILMIKKDPSESKSTNNTSINQPVATPDNTGSTEKAPPPMAQVSDLPKRIVGNWKVTKRLVGGFPTSGSGKIGTGAWLFYDDGSLKYTTGQYADMGTWKLDNEKFTVSLYALGKHSGYISAIDAKSMIWVTNEVVDGNPAAVSNYLERIK
ncbi:MAG: hypothetical protein ABIQ11_10035, partial [Saprospiraceae bacterium]